MDRQRFQVDFLVHNPKPAYYDEEARALGASIITCPTQRIIWTYLYNLTKILRECRPYDVIHSSIGNAALHMQIAHHLRVPIRISHIHADLISWAMMTGVKPSKLKFLYYKYISPYLLIKHSTLVLAVTEEAAIATLGKKMKLLKHWEILPCGIELDSFCIDADQKSIRKELGIPESAFVIGHAGRFAWQKNPIFLVKIAAEVNRSEPNMRLLLLGDGPLRAEIEAEAARTGIVDKVIFTGLRPDVPRIMLGAMDVFVFPSFFEGLPLAVLEAQAAGLPCFISDTIVEEAEVVKPLVKHLSLHDSASIWAEAVLAAKNTKSDSTRAQALKILGQSIFNIENNVARLEEFYSP